MLECWSLKGKRSCFRGVPGWPLKTEDGVELFVIMPAGPHEEREPIGRMFPVPEERGLMFYQSEKIFYADKLEGEGALLLVTLRSFTDGQIRETNFYCPEGKFVTRVNSSVDGLPLAELWILEKDQRFFIGGKEMMVIKDDLAYGLASVPYAEAWVRC